MAGTLTVMPPVTNSDVTMDTPSFSSSSPVVVNSNNHGGSHKYPPLRFLSRESSGGGGISATDRDESASPTRSLRAASDDGSDYSYSSADTMIYVTPDGQRRYTNSSNSLASTSFNKNARTDAVVSPSALDEGLQQRQVETRGGEVSTHYSLKQPVLSTHCASDDIHVPPRDDHDYLVHCANKIDQTDIDRTRAYNYNTTNDTEDDEGVVNRRPLYNSTRPTTATTDGGDQGGYSYVDQVSPPPSEHQHQQLHSHGAKGLPGNEHHHHHPVTHRPILHQQPDNITGDILDQHQRAQQLHTEEYEDRCDKSSITTTRTLRDNTDNRDSATTEPCQSSSGTPDDHGDRLRSGTDSARRPPIIEGDLLVVGGVQTNNGYDDGGDSPAKLSSCTDDDWTLSNGESACRDLGPANSGDVALLGESVSRNVRYSPKTTSVDDVGTTNTSISHEIGNDFRNSDISGPSPKLDCSSSRLGQLSLLKNDEDSETLPLSTTTTTTSSSLTALPNNDRIYSPSADSSRALNYNTTKENDNDQDDSQIQRLQQRQGQPRETTTTTERLGNVPGETGDRGQVKTMNGMYKPPPLTTQDIIDSEAMVRYGGVPPPHQHLNSESHLMTTRGGVGQKMRTLEPEERHLIMESPIPHPSVTGLQGENMSDTSSVDSEGVPYRKSALKIRQKGDTPKRTGRKVRFAEPIVMGEPKTIGLSARERLGLVDLDKPSGSGGGNRYVYTPQGLKRASQVGDDQMSQSNNSTTPKVNQRVASDPETARSEELRSRYGTSLYTEQNQTTNSEHVNGDIGYLPDIRDPGVVQYNHNLVNGTGQPPLSQDVEHSGRASDPAWDTSSSQNQSYTTPQGHTDQPGYLASNTTNDDDTAGKKRTRIIRRPGIHVTRQRDSNISSGSDSSNHKPVSPAPVSVRRPAPANDTKTPDGLLKTISEEPSSLSKSPVPDSLTSYDSEESILRPKSVQPSKARDGSLRRGVYYAEKNRKSIVTMDAYDQQQPPTNAVTDTTRNTRSAHNSNNPVAEWNTHQPNDHVSNYVHNGAMNHVRDTGQHTHVPPSSNPVIRNGPVPGYDSLQPQYPGQHPRDVSLVPAYTGPPDLVVVPPQSDTSSVPSPVSGDSGISSSSSLTDIPRDAPITDSGVDDSYSTLKYIKSNKTRHIMDRVDNMRRSQTRITNPKFHSQDSLVPESSSSSVVRRDSERTRALRREVVSDTPSMGSAGDVWSPGGRLGNHPPAVSNGPLRSPHDYDGRTASLTFQDPPSHSARRTSWSSEDPQRNADPPYTPNYNSDNHAVSPSPVTVPGHGSGNPAHYQDDENPYGSFMKSATNRTPAKSKLTRIPMDILSPRLPPDPELTPQVAKKSLPPPSPAPSYNNDDTSSRLSISSGYHSLQDNGSAVYSRLPDHQDRSLGSSRSPQYSSTANIYERLKQQMKNPYVRSNDFR